MKTWPRASALSFLCIVALGAVSAAANGDTLVSPFASTVQGLDIGNAHLVLRKQGTVLRGSAPRPEQASELVRHGVTDVVIFKNAVGTEVQDEIHALTAAGLDHARITPIPFRWSHTPAFRVSCHQIVQALKALDSAVSTQGRTAYFHCTMGEDRTGLLAGLFRMLETGESVRDAFENELCAHGYEAGDPHKPANVVNTVREELTPVFLKMAYLVQNGALAPGRLDDSTCDTDPAESRGFEGTEFAQPERFRCEASSLAR